MEKNAHLDCYVLEVEKSYLYYQKCAHPSEIASKSLSSSGIGDGMLAVLVVRGMGETLAGAR